MSFLIKNHYTGHPDVAGTVFVYGTVLCCVKLLFSGITIMHFSLSPFSGTDFAAAVGALGAIYAARKHSDNITK